MRCPWAPGTNDAAPSACMKPHISLITLATGDVERAVTFDRDGLGPQTQGIVGSEFEHGAVAFFWDVPITSPAASSTSEAAVQAAAPNQTSLCELDLRGVIVTARGIEHDFVSRFFAPKCGIPEDPVTGSAHCELAPYWAEHLGRTRLNARQVSRRGGEVRCEVKGDRVLLSDRAVTFMDALIDIGGDAPGDGK